jgi:alanine racemase
MDTQAYSTWLEIDLGAIRNNIKVIKKMTGTLLMAVIKANGYGHGALQVAKAATEAGAEWLGVARMEEALNLREQGISSEIMVLGYTPSSLIPDAITHSIHVAIYDPEMAKAYIEATENISGRLKIHVKVETGMGRLGMAPEKVARFIETYHEDDRIEIDGIFTHYARADEPGADTTTQQLARFDELLNDLRKADLLPSIIHSANSAAVLNYPETYFDLVRPGIAIYGLNPSPESSLPEDFQPALTWKARLTSVRTLPSGHGVSYGHKYFTSGDERIGVIPVGYGDGYRRVDGQQVLVHGMKVDVVGRVCMDQCMLQLDPVPGAVSGEEAVLLGRQGDQKITAGDLAEKWGTINYEVVCGLADRLPRIYLNA